MAKEKNNIIKYQGNQITMFSDDRNDYINLTEIAVASGDRKSIGSWLKNRQTIDFLCAWEKKNNTKFTGGQIPPSLLDKIKKTGKLSVQEWIETTNSIGIFSRVRGNNPGTWAHKDIAIKFAGWINPEFELFLIEEIQRLKKIEEQKNSYELLSHEQILALVRLKEVFKYVAHQEAIEEAHKQVYAAKSQSKNPFADFNKWRNQILDIQANIIDERIKEYCINNQIALTKKMLNKTKREKILMLDSYETVRNAVWDFLTIKEEINALNLANLVSEIMRTEKGEVHRRNETDLFQVKQDLGQFNDFEQKLSEMKVVKTARQILIDRQKSKILIGKKSK